MNNYEMSSNVFEIAEHKTYLELTRRLCWYGAPNLNGVELPIEDAENKAQTLVNQPVVAKYKKINKKDDLGGHECVITKEGEFKFNTEPIGVNTSVEIKNDNVEINGEIVNVPCLFATSRIWKRNKNVCAAIKRLFAEKLLHSSWEVITNQYEVINDKKILKEYEFEADCLLGSKSKPAYGNCATTITLAQENDFDPEILIAEAIQKDFERKEKEEDDNNMETNTVNSTATNIPANADTATVIDNADTVVTSALTDRDIRRKIEKAYRETYNNWCWLAFLFPEENYALLECDGRESELEYTKVAYTVSDDTVTIGDVDKIKLAVSVININSEIESKNAEINEKNEALIKADENIKSLNEEIEALSEYKEMYEKAEKEKAEKLLAERQENLKSYAIKSGYISEDEINNSDEIKTMIASVDETAIKSLIVDRLMSQKAEIKKSDEKENIAETNEIITSSVVNDINDGDYKTDYKSIIKSFLKG